jgi:hypothetical protein
MPSAKATQERRKCRRYAFQRPVSLRLGHPGRELWRLGWIRNAGAGGMKIRLNGKAFLHRHQSVTVMLQARPGEKARQMEEEVCGRIAWVDEGSNSFGLRYE